MLEKQKKRINRHKRIKAKIKGTVEVPRFFVFRSNNHIYTQLIDDENGKTILSSSDFELKKSKTKEEKTIAYRIGKLTAEKALKNKIEKVIFDRGGFKYHGKIKAIAEGAREGGLQF